MTLELQKIEDDISRLCREEQLNDDFGVVELLTGDREDGTPGYAYILVDLHRLFDFKRKVENLEDIVIEEYGTILKEGSGAFPSVEVQREMSEQYGVDHGLPQALDKLLKGTKT